MRRWLIASGVLILILILFIILARTMQSSAPAQNKTHPASEKIEEITINLPGASAIEARIEDYNSPNSIWVVVNKNTPLQDVYYRPSDLSLLTKTSRTDKSNDERSIRSIALDDFDSMINASLEAGHDLIVGSGFRSHDLQAYYFNNYVSTYGEEQANKFSAKPGYSEHQTGLVVDIAYRSMQCYLDTCFGETTAGKWIANNAFLYGFIIRYPADKTDITKYQYEPWHLRYVGKPLAKSLKQSGLTLDEAHPFLMKVRDELIASGKINVQ